MGFRKSGEAATLSNALLPSNLDMELLPRRGSTVTTQGQSLLPSSEGLLLINEGLVSKAKEAAKKVTSSATNVTTSKAPVSTTNTAVQPITNEGARPYLFVHAIAGALTGAGAAYGVYKYRHGQNKKGVVLPIFVGVLASLVTHNITYRTHQYISSH